MRLSEKLLETFERKINPRMVDSIILPDGGFIEDDDLTMSSFVDDCDDCILILNSENAIDVYLPEEFTKMQKNSLRYYIDEYSWSIINLHFMGEVKSFDMKFGEGTRNVPLVMREVMSFYN